MIGFLLKLIVIAVIASGFYFVVYPRLSGKLPSVNPLAAIQSLPSRVKDINISHVGSRLSSTLDSLVTHSDKSPMVMGIDITNQSLAAVVDTLQHLPPNELQQIRNYLCQPPPASPSATPSATPSAK